MRVLPFILLFSLISLTACEQEKNLGINENKKQIIFVSDEAQLHNEVPYYDAIIELRKQFPEEFKEMKTISPGTAKEFSHLYNMNNSPALLVVYKKEVIGIVDGESPKEEIIDTIEKALKD